MLLCNKLIEILRHFCLPVGLTVAVRLSNLLNIYLKSFNQLVASLFHFSNFHTFQKHAYKVTLIGDTNAVAVKKLMF